MLTEDFVCRAAAQAGLSPFASVVRRLDGPGPNVEISPEAAFYPASMIKTPLAAAVLSLVQDGEIALDQPCEVGPSNMTVNDKPSPLTPGYTSNVRELLELMITLSDNVATNVLLDIVGRDRATGIVQQRFGLRGTAFHRKLSGALPLIADPRWDRIHLNTHPPADAALLFELIARSRVPFAWTLRSVLARQDWNDRLSMGLHHGDTFAHKTGSTDEVMHDGGILETDDGKTYVVVAYTGMESTDENDRRLGTFMRTLRAAL
ncbi:MAG TPA: serine hydrolase [Candidatus Baltobacteraceae bacterium]